MSDILQYMYQSGLLTSKELVSLRKTCRELNENPVRVLRSLNVSSPDEIQTVMQRAYRIPAVTDKLIDSLDESFKALIPIDIALHYGVFAVAEDDDTLHVAMEDPSDKGLVHRLEFFLERRIIPVSATVYQIAQALNKLYELNPDQLKLTTVIESSRGIVAGVKRTTTSQIQAPEVTNLSQLAANFSANGDREHNAVQSLTERVMAATPPAKSIDLEEESIEAAPAGSQSMSLDDLAESEAHAAASASQTTSETPTPQAAAGGTDLFDELSSPEVLGGAPKEVSGGTDLFDELSSPEVLGGAPKTAPVDLTPGDIAFFDDPAPATTSESASPQPNQASASPTTDALADSLDSSLGASLDGSNDIDLGAVASMENALDDNNALALDDEKNVSEPVESLNDTPPLQSESQLEDSQWTVPGLSEAIDPSSSLVIDDTVTQDTIAAAEQLLADDATVDETFLAADNIFVDSTETAPAEDHSEAQYQEIPQQIASNITTATNGLLVKLAMTPSKAKALETINQKTASLGLQISLKDSQTLVVAWQDSSQEIPFADLEKKKEQSRIIELIFPVLKKLEKLK